MTFPVGPLLQELAKRVLANLLYIEGQGQECGTPCDAAYPDTQLLISLLGVLVFPHERTPDALGELIRDYPNIQDVVEVIHPRGQRGPIEITNELGEIDIVDVSRLENLPRLLRNSIAHFNILPLRNRDQFDGIRIWNVDRTQVITFIADVRFDALRPLAKHILSAIGKPERYLKLDNPVDPMILAGKYDEDLRPLEETATRRKPPKIIQDAWLKILLANNNDYNAAKQFVDRTLSRAVTDLLSRKAPR